MGKRPEPTWGGLALLALLLFIFTCFAFPPVGISIIVTILRLFGLLG